jgi:hypothetical protein
MRPDVHSNQPPRLATWLLERLTSDEKRESLIGDLLEQYVHGRSAAWYWRQAIGSILAGSVRDIRDHKLLAVRAVLVGLAAMSVFGALDRFFLQVVSVLASGGIYFGGHWVTLDYGWMRNRLYIAFLLALLGAAASGWIVGRLHRRHQMPMVFAFLVSVVLASMLQMAIQVMLVGWTIRPIVQYSQTIVVVFVFVPCCILLGGLMSGPGSLDASGQSHRVAAATTAGRETQDEDS